MTAVFVDTNIVVYAYANDPLKSSVAEAIVSATPVLSTQVINEFLNVARIKMRLDLATRHKIAHNLLHGCTVVSLDVQVVAHAMAVEATYQVSYWDALVISAALAAGCDTLYSEDMQNGQVFENCLTVRNPFVTRSG